MLQPIIGLEIHVQLKTKSKMFCGCDNRGEDAEPNTTVCPICMGHPGTLPVANALAVRWSLMTGLALGCTIPNFSKFDRKNYFYPDLPKGYQISQYDQPFCVKGLVSFQVPTSEGTYTKKVRITRLHLEEDAAKLQHSADGQWSFVDFNRAGTPLAEIVTEPDFRTPQEAKAFLQELRLAMRYLGVSDADMEKGHLRCDANISLRQIDERELVERDQDDFITDYSTLSPKTEVKNINSFRSVERALEYEIKRQTKLFEEGAPVNHLSTRGWNDQLGITEDQRSKEEAHDYRYFPEPDLPPFTFTPEDIESIRRELPELPWQKRERFVSEYHFSGSDAHLLCEDLALANLAEKVMMELSEVDFGNNAENEVLTKQHERLARLVAGWLTSKLSGLLHARSLTLDTIKATPEHMAKLLSLIATNRVNSSSALTLLDEMIQTGADPDHLLEERGVSQVSDDESLNKEIETVIDEHATVVADVQAGKTAALQFLVGQIMKRTKGRANPQRVGELLRERLGINE